MNEEARKLREKVEGLEEQFTGVKTKLENYVENCRHQFSETVYDPIYTKGYTIPGDPPGVGGSDHRFPVEVPSKTEDRWRRECNECGLAQYTKNVEEKIKKIPKWRN